MDEYDQRVDDQNREARDDIDTPSHSDQLPDGNYVGEDNIREGRVGGIIGGKHQQGGEGQGG